MLLIKANGCLLKAIRVRDWLQFALIYNGSAQKGCDIRMRESYESLNNHR